MSIACLALLLSNKQFQEKCFLSRNTTSLTRTVEVVSALGFFVVFVVVVVVVVDSINGIIAGRYFGVSSVFTCVVIIRVVSDEGGWGRGNGGGGGDGRYFVELSMLL